MSIYNWLMLLVWLIFLGYWFISAFNTKQTAVYGWQWIITRLVLAAIIVALFYAKVFDHLDQSSQDITTTPFLSTVGVILAMLGIGFAIWARKNLGTNWGMPMTIKAEPELVTSGPYHYVRHPIYTGVLLAIIGSALVSGLGWLIMAIIFAVYFIYSAEQEEKVMLQKFPNQYPEYKARTKMLIPFVF